MQYRMPIWFRGFLSACAGVPDLVGLLQGPVRFFYLSIVLEAFRLQFPAGVRVLARHSILEKSFNPFISDLDVTIVVPDESKLEDVLHVYRRVMKWFPMIDAPEFHTDAEEAELVRLKEKWDELFLEIWNLRKLGWIRRELLQTSDPHQQEKLASSIHKTEKKLGLESNQMEIKGADLSQLSLIISNAGPHDPCICLCLPYLVTGRAGDIVLLLSTEEFSSFYNFFPTGRYLKGQSSDWYEAKRALTYYELLLAKNAVRRKGEVDPVHLQWIECLEKEVSGVDQCGA